MAKQQQITYLRSQQHIYPSPRMQIQDREARSSSKNSYNDFLRVSNHVETRLFSSYSHNWAIQTQYTCTW